MRYWDWESGVRRERVPVWEALRIWCAACPFNGLDEETFKVMGVEG